MSLTHASQERIKVFVDWFIRRDEVRPDIQDLILSDPDRADRMYDAAEDGSDGSTHQEIIDDWRREFSHWVHYSRKGWHNAPERFIAAVEDHFDSVEQWHQEQGSLDQEVG